MRTGFSSVCLLAVALFAIGHLEAAEPKVLLSSKVATDGDFLTLPVMVDGQKYSFMVDTGTKITTLHSSFREKLVEVEDSDEKREVRPGVWSKLYQAPSMTIMGSEVGSLEFPDDLPVLTIDLSEPRRASDQAIDGVLGMDFLEHYALQLDLNIGNLRLLDSQSLTDLDCEATRDIVIVDGRPYMEIHAGDVSFPGMIDTGALLTLDLRRETYDYLMDNKQIYQFPFEIEIDGQMQLKVTDRGCLKEFRVGPFKHHLLVIDCYDPISLVGLNYWRRYQVTFDFPRKLVYLDKGPLFDVLDDSFHAGLFIQPAEGNGKLKVVTHIIKGCFAERNGVQVGDQVLSIDGEGVEESSVNNIKRRLNFRHDRECVLRLSRDGKEFDVTLPASGLVPQLNDDAK